MSFEQEDGIARAIRHANEKAGPAMAANFVHPSWVMSADEFRTFWGGTRMASVATTGARGWPHAAPVEVSLEKGTFLVPAFANSVRMSDMRREAHVAITAWDDAWHASIIYGTAAVSDDVTASMVRVTPSRIYAIRAPIGHPAARHQP